LGLNKWRGFLADSSNQDKYNEAIAFVMYISKTAGASLDDSEELLANCFEKDLQYRKNIAKSGKQFIKVDFISGKDLIGKSH
jgi:hypothetical protein